jgi:hypothetical protein
MIIIQGKFPADWRRKRKTFEKTHSPQIGRNSGNKFTMK